MPKWNDWALRLAGSYDLFGNGKTALKANASKYTAAEAASYAATFSQGTASYLDGYPTTMIVDGQKGLGAGSPTTGAGSQYTFSPPTGKVRTAGLPANLANVFATSIKAANGELDLGNAKRVTFEGKTAYAVTIRDAAAGPVNPSTVSVTLFVDATTNKAIAARWGEGSTLWRTVYLQGFERLDDTPANQAHLEF